MNLAKRSCVLGCAAVLALVLVGCDGDPADDAGGDTLDSGPGVDSGPGDDAGPGDAGPPLDAGPGDDGGFDGGSDPCDAVDCTGLDDACNTGVCDAATGACMAVPPADDTVCDDADMCTTNDVCTTGVCAGAAPDCSGMDGVCVMGVCDPTSGSCIADPVADTTACDDGFVCTRASACMSGACIGSGLACTAGEPDLTAITTTPTAGGFGGSAVTGTCPAGRVLIGFRGEIETGNALVDRPGATTGVCGTIAIDPAGVITTTEQGAIGPFATGDDPPPRTTWARLCPADEVVVGYAAQAGAYIFQLTVRCAPLTLGAPAAGYPLLVGAAADLAPVGSVAGTASGPFDCAAGEAAVGVEARAGAWIDSFGLQCAPVAANL